MPPKRGGGRGGGKRGPDMSWEDPDETTPKDNESFKKVPGPKFPSIRLRVPRPIDADERKSVESYLQFRDLARKGPYYAILEQSQLTDIQTGKVHKRAGFDPFNDQERYSAKFHRKKRTVPDLSTRNYALHTFPQELWPNLDPKYKHPLWQTIENPASLGRPRISLKRKRENLPKADDDEEQKDEDANNSDDSGEVLSGSRRARNGNKAGNDPKPKKSKEKQGLDAEDDYGDDDGKDVDDDDDGEGVEDEVEDSEFSESEDGDDNDYNAEQYFDGGDGDDDDYGGDDDGGGGTYQ